MSGGRVEHDGAHADSATDGAEDAAIGVEDRTVGGFEALLSYGLAGEGLPRDGGFQCCRRTGTVMVLMCPMGIRGGWRWGVGHPRRWPSRLYSARTSLIPRSSVTTWGESTQGRQVR